MDDGTRKVIFVYKDCDRLAGAIYGALPDGTPRKFRTIMAGFMIYAAANMPEAVCDIIDVVQHSRDVILIEGGMEWIRNGVEPPAWITESVEA